jgi:hypothetical protein
MRWLASPALIASLLATPTYGASLPRFPKGTPYSEARRSLIALGYQPFSLPDADELSRSLCGFAPVVIAKREVPQGDNERCFPEMDACGDDERCFPEMDACGDDERCFPEMEACAGTGLGQCIYSWRRGVTLIEVLTTNELPVVSGVRCRANC